MLTTEWSLNPPATDARVGEVSSDLHYAQGHTLGHKKKIVGLWGVTADVIYGLRL